MVNAEPAVSSAFSAPTPCASRPHPPARRPVSHLQVLSPRHAPPAAGPSPLMSPLVFAQPPWAPPPERGSGLLPPGSQDPAATPSGSLLPLRTPEPPRTPGSALTKPQLQEALLHLIQVGGRRLPPRRPFPAACCPAGACARLLLPKGSSSPRDQRFWVRFRHSVWLWTL